MTETWGIGWIGNNVIAKVRGRICFSKGVYAMLELRSALTILLCFSLLPPIGELFAQEVKNCLEEEVKDCAALDPSCGLTLLGSSCELDPEFMDENEDIIQNPHVTYDSCPPGQSEGWSVNMTSVADCAGNAIASLFGDVIPDPNQGVQTKTCWIKRPCKLQAEVSTITDGKCYGKKNGNEDTSNWVWKYKAVCGSFGSNPTQLDDPQKISWQPCVVYTNCRRE